MIDNFDEITNSIYRGAAPSVKDVVKLKSKFGINKIVSLDRESSDNIDEICNLLDIEHITIPLDTSKKSLLKLFSYDLKDLLSDGPTFIHCKHGKDRTGFVAALYKCKYLDYSPEEALDEAKLFGFGINADPKMIDLYTKVIMSCNDRSNDSDVNNADIVSNTRTDVSDTKSGVLDEASQLSFAPYLSQTKQDPYDKLYHSIDDQYPTRQNYNKMPYEYDTKDYNAIPLVGAYDNEAGINGAGPSTNTGGFIHD